MAANKRTRTGCRTCRSRKLKCDEGRPICGQCRKSNRECIPSEGITFRHAQNPGLNATSNDLGNFYKYRQKYNADHFFLPIPKDLKFVHVTDPYEDESLSTPSANYQQVAAHSLEALSTAATGDQPSTMNQPSYTDYTPAAAAAAAYTQIPNHPIMTKAMRAAQIQAQAQQARLDNQNNDINFLLNPSSTPSAMIDPNLEDAVSIATHHSQQDGTSKAIGGMSEADTKAMMVAAAAAAAAANEHVRDDDNMFENQILAALQSSEATVDHS